MLPLHKAAAIDKLSFGASNNFIFDGALRNNRAAVAALGAPATTSSVDTREVGGRSLHRGGIALRNDASACVIERLADPLYQRYRHTTYLFLTI